jgi:hypothetical protein
MKISDTTTRTLTIVLEGREIADIQTICRGYLGTRPFNSSTSATGTAQNILESLEVD